MNLPEWNQTETDSAADSLLQAVGVMRNVSRSIGYIEQRLSAVAELKDLDPRLRRELKQLRSAMNGLTGEVMLRLSLMGTTVTDLLKEAEQCRCADPQPSGEARRGRDQARRGNKEFEVIPGALM